jgi:NAD(P)-dependent dehydrogenase (short-subunit alcohol dehydrogenase family)/acyl carrier protein
MLDRGLASYILLSATKVSGLSPEALGESNRLALTNLLAYAVPSGSESEESEESQLLYDVEWRQAAPPTEASAGAGWLLVATREQTTAELAQKLTAQGVRCVQVQAGASYAQLGPDRYQMPLSSTALRRLLQEAFGYDKPCSRAVFMSALDLPAPGAATELGVAVAGLCSEATNLAQALVAHGFRTAPRLYLVTRGAQSVNGRGPVQVAQAPLCGLGKTIALEHPELRCTRLDLDPSIPVQPAALLREMSGADREDQVALRSGERYVARLVRAPAAWAAKGAEETPIRGDRSYLITGGLGGLGLTVARWLVQRGAGLVFLAGRKEPAAQAQRLLKELNQSGVKVRSVQADVAQAAQVTRLLAEIEQSGKPLAGVVHAAGVLHDKMLLEQTRELFSEVLAPKAMGAWNLHQQLNEHALDFFVLYSSAAALCGSPGQGNYCAANAFLDALAQQRRHEGKKALSIQWGAFSEVGMAVAQDNRGKRVAGMGFLSLSPDDGLRLLEKLLPSSMASIGAMRLNARQLVETMPSAAGLPFFSDLAKSSSGQKRRGKAAQKMLETLQAALETERQRLLLEHLCEQFGAVLQQEPSRLDPHAPFQSLGVDSLMSLEIRNRLEESLGVRLGATVLYTYASLAALSQHLIECLGIGAEDTKASKQDEHAKAQPLPNSDLLEQLSDADLAAMGEALLS